MKKNQFVLHWFLGLVGDIILLVESPSSVDHFGDSGKSTMINDMMVAVF